MVAANTVTTVVVLSCYLSNPGFLALATLEPRHPGLAAAMVSPFRRNIDAPDVDY